MSFLEKQLNNLSTYILGHVCSSIHLEYITKQQQIVTPAARKVTPRHSQTNQDSDESDKSIRFDQFTVVKLSSFYVSNVYTDVTDVASDFWSNVEISHVFV